MISANELVYVSKVKAWNDSVRTSFRAAMKTVWGRSLAKLQPAGADPEVVFDHIDQLVALLRREADPLRADLLFGFDVPDLTDFDADPREKDVIMLSLRRLLRAVDTAQAGAAVVSGTRGMRRAPEADGQLETHEPSGVKRFQLTLWVKERT